MRSLPWLKKKLNETVPANQPENDYQSPGIEQVVTRENLEREAAYAGTPAPTPLP
jgi:hypothetical protein